MAKRKDSLLSFHTCNFSNHFLLLLHVLCTMLSEYLMVGNYSHASSFHLNLKQTDI